MDGYRRFLRRTLGKSVLELPEGAGGSVSEERALVLRHLDQGLGGLGVANLAEGGADGTTHGIAFCRRRAPSS